MPISVSVCHVRRLIHFTLSGGLDTAEMLLAVDDALGQLDGGVYDVLSDHRAVTTPATPEQVKAVIDRLKPAAKALEGRRGAIVVSNDTSYGMMRMFSAHAEYGLGFAVQVFRDLAAAQESLGLQPG